ncbi:YbjN domain-containing protein [Actinomyces sp. B33]|uniref:YbjN domain-containing protein n=1 Tax=Actinomyces sp. B33 TaxID=2942131 RepID=UPI0023426648|nr:YbjN domain-containing protein [Actinomyces sp. B33]MDC4233407.1 YbjN domain-containing protein [Actinomyces sp. B33]
MTGPFAVPSDDATPYPADFDRVVARVHDMGYDLDILEKGRAAGAVFDRVPFLLSFDASGRFLSIRAMWETELAGEQAGRCLFAAADNWNREKYFPTVYTMPGESGAVQVCADFVLDTSAGVSNDQLEDAVSAGISTGISAIDYMKEAAAHALGRASDSQ